jgi:hypothetical protein
MNNIKPPAPSYTDDKENFYYFVAHNEDVERSECDPEQAAKLLEYAAEYLENGEVVPAPLAQFIAQAFRRASVTEQEKRPAELAAWLNLTAPNRRPKVHENELGCWMYRKMIENPSQSETSTLREAVKHFDISKTTATDNWKAWQKKNAKYVENLTAVRAYLIRSNQAIRKA